MTSNPTLGRYMEALMVLCNDQTRVNAFTLTSDLFRYSTFSLTTPPSQFMCNDRVKIHQRYAVVPIPKTL